MDRAELLYLGGPGEGGGVKLNGNREQHIVVVTWILWCSWHTKVETSLRSGDENIKPDQTWRREGTTCKWKGPGTSEHLCPWPYGKAWRQQAWHIRCQALWPLCCWELRRHYPQAFGCKSHPQALSQAAFASQQSVLEHLIASSCLEQYPASWAPKRNAGLRPTYPKGQQKGES